MHELPSTIIVPRMGEPITEDGNRSPIFPEVERQTEIFHTGSLIPWQHPSQTREKVQVWTILGHFVKEQEMLQKFLGIRELTAIRALGPALYRNYVSSRFRGARRLLGPKSLSETVRGPAMPFIAERFGDLYLGWVGGDDILTDRDVAPRLIQRT
jgi:hypothetical protein